MFSSTITQQCSALPAHSRPGVARLVLARAAPALIFVEHALEISSYSTTLSLWTRRRTYVGTRLNRCPTTICTTRGMACKTDSQELADSLPARAVPAGRPARWWRPCAAGGESIACCRQNRFFTAVTEMLCMAEKSRQNVAVLSGQKRGASWGRLRRIFRQ